MTSVLFRPRAFQLDLDLDTGACLSRLRDRAGLAALDSAAGSGFTLIVFDPVGAPFRHGPGDWVGGLGARLSELTTEAGEPVPGPFQGGFVGALAYDLGAPGERPVAVPPSPVGLPLTSGGIYVDFLVRETRGGPWWLVLGEDPGDARPPVAARRAAIEGALRAPDPRGPAEAATPRRRVDAAEHRRRVEVVRERIAAGDVYQVNLAHPFECATRGAPVDFYRALRTVNPAPYMGFCHLEGPGGERIGALLSASPELLLEYDGELLRTRPIKGTAPRGASAEEDRALARALLESEKDRAELVMIVDLERNDLGRIARPGGVRVEGLGRLESYARVHHLMADVCARPAAGVGALEALAALFPGGSVTGAPKLAAMDVIGELEGEGRGYFCGALGFLDGRGHARFNLLIRTLEWRPRDGASPAATNAWDGEVSFRVGGGITWSSDAAAEDDETLAKARGLIEALAARGA